MCAGIILMNPETNNQTMEYTSFVMGGVYVPYKHEPVSSMKGYFSEKIESIQKDVECVFGILKKSWRILDYVNNQFHNIHVVEKVLVVCCMLHNNMLSEMETTDSDAHVGLVDQLMEMVFCSGEKTESLEWRTINY